MLFATPTSAKDQEAGDVSMGMDIDMSMREDHGDVDMYSDSPAKTARNIGYANEDTAETAEEAKNEEVPTKTTTSLLSSVLRPINGNAVKRVEKQRSKTPHSKTLGRSAGASGSRQETALVLRDDGEMEQEQSEESSEDEDDLASCLITYQIPKTDPSILTGQSRRSRSCHPSPATPKRSLGPPFRQQIHSQPIRQQRSERPGCYPVSEPFTVHARQQG